MNIDNEFEGFWLDVLSGNEELDVMPQNLDADKTKALHLAQALRSVLTQDAKAPDTLSLDDEEAFIDGVMSKLDQQ